MYHLSNRNLLLMMASWRGGEEMTSVDVCGRCCVIEEIPPRGGGSNFRNNGIKRADDTFFPDNRQGGP
jgi:hypothetical protein